MREKRKKQKKRGQNIMKIKCKTEVFSRVTGFFRPVQTWNKGKVEEFKHRNRFNISDKGVNEERKHKE